MPRYLQDFFSSRVIACLIIISLVVLVIRIWIRAYETEKKETLLVFLLNTLKYIFISQLGFFFLLILAATGILDFLQYVLYIIGILFILIYPILAIMNGGDL